MPGDALGAGVLCVFAADLRGVVGQDLGGLDAGQWLGVAAHRDRAGEHRPLADAAAARFGDL
jgi:hypothetical protein